MSSIKTAISRGSGAFFEPLELLRSLSRNKKRMEDESRTKWALGTHETYRSEDRDFKVKQSWSQLGGSRAAEEFLHHAPFHAPHGHKLVEMSCSSGAREACAGWQELEDQEACVYEYCQGEAKALGKQEDVEDRTRGLNLVENA